MQKNVGIVLSRLATLVLPALLLVLAAVALLWQLVHNEARNGTPVAMQVLEGTDPVQAADLPTVLQRLAAQPAVAEQKTHLSRNPFWFSFDVSTPRAEAQDVDFPSRHAMDLQCWDAVSLRVLGSGDRAEVSGAIQASRAGFALSLVQDAVLNKVVCVSHFRGPARLRVELWPDAPLVASRLAHRNTGVMIETAIGVLAIFMLLTAAVNRSPMYLAFVGGLILNMRMAALSVGTDTSIFGIVIDPAWLIFVRQWTLCLYYAMTIGLFSVLLEKELEGLTLKWPLSALQLSALVLLAMCPWLVYEDVLPVLWVSTCIGVLVILFYLSRIFEITRSRVAAWYGASLVITLASSLNEVMVAAIGKSVWLAGLNGVTAAIASALLACVAVAEHMRTHRIENQQAQRLLEAAYQDSPVGLFTVSDGQRIIKCNPAFQSMVQSMGGGQLDLLADVFLPDAVAPIVALYGHAETKSVELQTCVVLPGPADPRWFAIRASTVDGSIIECSLQDITERVQANLRLEHLASHDPLTGCLNLRGLALASKSSKTKPSALAYFDLDRFKLINDLYGHHAGDNVLQQVAERMQGVLNRQDKLARVGGDEFVVVFCRESMAESVSTCNTIAMLIGSTPFEIDSQSFSLDVSGGLVGTEHFDGSALEDIVSAADTLCRVAKKRNDRRIVVMESGDGFFQRHQDELDLIDCLERGETPQGLFFLMQPEISLSRPFESLNFEILVRLRKPDGTVVPASTIIEAAEAHGKTAIIDRWVVTNAIAWLEAHVEALQNTHFVGLNLSGGSLNDESFTEELFTLFEQHPVALSKICIEITETVAITDMRNMQRFIDRVRAIGAKVGLDDFGAGYSSFGYLKGLSVDALKLDGSLVRDAARSQSGMAIITAIGGLVRSLGMKSVGEFAEDLATIRALFDAGIDYAQGYGISKPVLPERILSAHSGADFIEDSEILQFVKQIQEEAVQTMPLFPEVAVPLGATPATQGQEAAT